MKLSDADLAYDVAELYHGDPVISKSLTESYKDLQSVQGLVSGLPGNFTHFFDIGMEILLGGSFLFPPAYVPAISLASKRDDIVADLKHVGDKAEKAFEGFFAPLALQGLALDWGLKFKSEVGAMESELDIPPVKLGDAWQGTAASRYTDAVGYQKSGFDVLMDLYKTVRLIHRG